MAGVSLLNNTESTANGSSYASGSFTPAQNDLLVVLVCIAGSLAEDATLTASANGITFTDAGPATHPKGNASANVHYIFVANQLVGASPASMTVTVDCSSDAGTGCSIDTFAVTSVSKTGSTAIKQIAGQSDRTATQTPTITFGANITASNPVLGAATNNANPAAITEPSGWTEASDTGHATPTTGWETTYIASHGGSTATVTWGAVSSTRGGGIAIEIDASSSGTPVGKDLQFLWNTRAIIGKSLQEIWNTRAPIGKSLDTRWTVLTRVNKDLGLVWHIRQAVGTSLDIRWNVRAAIAKSLELLWNVLGTAGAIGKDLGLVWNVNATAGKDLGLIWNTRAAIGKSLQAIWNVRAAVGKSLQAIWNVRTFVGKSLQEIWNTRAAVGKSLDARWNVRALATKTLQLVWIVNTKISKDLSLQWRVLTFVGKSLDARWNVRQAVGKPLTIYWDTDYNFTWVPISPDTEVWTPGSPDTEIWANTVEPEGIKPINLLPAKDSTFDTGEALTWGAFFGGLGAAEKSTVRAHSGTTSMRLTWRTNTPDGADVAFNNLTGLVDGAIYRFTAWVYSESGSPLVRPSGLFWLVDTAVKVHTTHDVWQQVEQYIQYFAGESVAIGFANVGAAVGTQYAWIDDIVVEEITSALRTPWAETPQDSEVWLP